MKLFKLGIIGILSSFVLCSCNSKSIDAVETVSIPFGSYHYNPESKEYNFDRYVNISLPKDGEVKYCYAGRLPDRYIMVNSEGLLCEDLVEKEDNLNFCDYIDSLFGEVSVNISDSTLTLEGFESSYKTDTSVIKSGELQGKSYKEVYNEKDGKYSYALYLVLDTKDNYNTSILIESKGKASDNISVDVLHNYFTSVIEYI